MEDSPRRNVNDAGVEEKTPDGAASPRLSRSQLPILTTHFLMLLLLNSGRTHQGNFTTPDNVMMGV